MLKGREKFLDTWCPAINRARHDYDSPDHVLAEMMHESYFGDFHQRFRKGDIVYVTDAANERVTLIIDDVDKIARKVRFSVDAVHTPQVVTADPEGVDDGLSIRWRGPRGGLFAVVNAKGEILKRDITTRQAAEIELATFRKQMATKDKEAA